MTVSVFHSRRPTVMSPTIYTGSIHTFFAFLLSAYGIGIGFRVYMSSNSFLHANIILNNYLLPYLVHCLFLTVPNITTIGLSRVHTERVASRIASRRNQICLNFGSVEARQVICI